MSESLQEQLNKIKGPLKILIQRADRTGDMLMSIAAISALKARFPQSEIHCIVSPAGEQVLKNRPEISQCWVIHEHSFKEMISIAPQLKDRQFHVFISLFHHPKLDLFGRLCHIPIRTGYTKKMLSHFCFNYGQSSLHNNLASHLIELNLNLLKDYGINTQLQSGSLIVPKHLSPALEKELSEKNSQNKDIIFIVTETGGSNIPFPTDVLSDFIQAINDSDKYFILISGQSKDNPFYGFKDLKNTLTLIGKSNFDDLIKCIDLSSYYVGPCTGPTHIASMLQKPTLVFSPLKKNPPSTFGSLSPKQIIIRQDYQFPKFSIENEDIPKLLEYLDADYLMKEFNTLVASKERSIEDVRDYHFKNSFRILYWPKKNESKQALNDLIQYYNDNGIKLFLCKHKSLFSIKKIMTQIITQNINILHGDFPFLITLFIRLHMGIVEKTVHPLSYKTPLVKKDPKALIKDYQSKFC